MKNSIAIIGGGIAGLSASIILAKKGFYITVYEKNTYPNHKVCGEYVSKESVAFLKELGIFNQMADKPNINRLIVSAPSGLFFKSEMKMGGIGISRYLFDTLLYEEAVKNGVSFIFEEVSEIKNNDTNQKIVETKNLTHSYEKVILAFGKRSNLDIKWERPFAIKAKTKLNQWVGIKHHIRLDSIDNKTIELHNFEGGYCGISRVENNIVCLCYLVSSAQLKNRNIAQLEKEVLQKNPFLKQIFNDATFIFDKPLAISQISFDKKMQVYDNMPMLGDAAGLITPLCGNGMSLALQSASILCKHIESKYWIENYQAEWKKKLAKRLFWGRIIQRGFGKSRNSELLIKCANTFPKIGNYLVQKSHGTSF